VEGGEGCAKKAITLAATAVVLFVGSLSSQANAQTTQGGASISDLAKGFTPIEKAASAPYSAVGVGPAPESPWFIWMLACSL
jgi:hypothetical protein